MSDSKCKDALTEQAEKATICSCKLSKVALIATAISLVVAAMSLVVATQTLRVTYFQVVQGVNDILNEVRREALQIMLSVKHSHDVENPYVGKVSAAQGDEITVQLYFMNTGERALDDISVRFVLPDALEFIPGSAVLYNRTNPDGRVLQDDVIDRWFGLGGYSTYDGEYRGSGTVFIKVRVSDDDALFNQGVNIFDIRAQMCGYIDGYIATDNYITYATLTVIVE